MAGVFATMLAAILSILTMNFIVPLFVLGGTMFAVIFLQYVLWGWWFEKIYRQPVIQAEERNDQ